MDNLCHTLTGAALGQAGLAATSRYGMATLLVAANLPDVDVLVFLTDTLPVSFRRGWTHGVLAQALLPVALAALVWTIGRLRPASPRLASQHPSSHPLAPAGTSSHPFAPAHDVRLAPLLLLAYTGVFSHVFLDFLNSYGIRLLMPFSERWFYGDALYIVDPWMWLVLGVGVWLGRRRRRRGAAQPWRPARLALALVAGYAMAMLGSNLWARAVVANGLERAGRAAGTRFMVTPVLANPLQREVLVDTGERYEKAFLWFTPAPRFRPAGYGVDRGFEQAEAREALAQPRARAYLRWSRFPFVVVDRSQAPPRLLLNDYRYSDATGRAGWAGLSIELDAPGPAPPDETPATAVPGIRESNTISR